MFIKCRIIKYIKRIRELPKEVRVCHFHKISVRKNGDVYPCCLAKKYSKLGNIFDDNIFETIENKNITCECRLFKYRDKLKDEKPNLKYLHLEFSNECQARCVCCCQQKEKLKNEDAHLAKISKIIDRYRPQNIISIGGEVLIQKKTLDWLIDTKNKYPEIKFDIVTNLCVKDETLDRIKNLFDYMTVSILGFSDTTYKAIMGLDYKRTLKNIDFIFNKTNIKLRLKYLMMPTNMYEMPSFLTWALSKKPEKIYLHNVREFKDIASIDNIYWKKSFAPLEKSIKKILLDNKERIISEQKHFISIHEYNAEFLHIDDEFLDKNGFRNIIKVTS